DPRRVGPGRSLRFLRRCSRLTPGQWWLLVSAWCRLLLVDVQLRAVGVQRTARMVPAPITLMASPRQLQRAENYAYWLRCAARHHVVRAQCLHQSLALHAWLRGEGLPSTIEIGVRRVGQEL